MWQKKKRKEKYIVGTMKTQPPTRQESGLHVFFPLIFPHTSIHDFIAQNCEKKSTADHPPPYPVKPAYDTKKKPEKK